MKLADIEIPLTLPNKNLFSPGIRNDITITPQFLQFVYQNTDWSDKLKSALYLDHIHDSADALVGYAKNVTISPNAFINGSLDFIDLDTLIKLQNGAKLGISPRIHVVPEDWTPTKEKPLPDYAAIDGFGVVVYPAASTTYLNSEKKDEEGYISFGKAGKNTIYKVVNVQKLVDSKDKVLEMSEETGANTETGAQTEVITQTPTEIVKLETNIKPTVSETTQDGRKETDSLKEEIKGLSEILGILTKEREKEKAQSAEEIAAKEKQLEEERQKQVAETQQQIIEKLNKLEKRNEDVTRETDSTSGKQVSTQPDYANMSDDDLDMHLLNMFRDWEGLPPINELGVVTNTVTA